MSGSTNHWGLAGSLQVSHSEERPPPAAHCRGGASPGLTLHLFLGHPTPTPQNPQAAPSQWCWPSSLATPPSTPTVGPVPATPLCALQRGRGRVALLGPAVPGPPHAVPVPSGVHPAGSPLEVSTECVAVTHPAGEPTPFLVPRGLHQRSLQGPRAAVLSDRQPSPGRGAVTGSPVLGGAVTGSPVLRGGGDRQGHGGRWRSALGRRDQGLL